MKKIYLPIFILFFSFILTSCGLQTKGDTLKSFTHRINGLSDTYELSETGYIFDKNEQTFSRFYKFDKEEINDIANRFCKDLAKKSKKYKPDLLLCWKIPSKIVKKGSDEYGMTYPGLWTIAKIYPPLQHKGARKNTQF